MSVLGLRHGWHVQGSLRHEIARSSIIPAKTSASGGQVSDAECDALHQVKAKCMATSCKHYLYMCCILSSQRAWLCNVSKMPELNDEMHALDQ